jgi:hypothetical protein
MGLVGIAGFAAKDAYYAISHAVFWLNSDLAGLQLFNYFADSAGGLFMSGILFFLIINIISKTIDMPAIIDFGVKFIVLHLAGLISFALFSLGTGLSHNQGDKLLPFLRDIAPCAPSLLIAMFVGLYGWRGTRQLHNAHWRRQSQLHA